MSTELPKGTAAVARLAKCSPYIAGDTFTYADLVGYFTFIYANRSAQANIDTDILGLISGGQAWYDLIGERDSVKKALADQSPA